MFSFANANVLLVEMDALNNRPFYLRLNDYKALPLRTTITTSPTEPMYMYVCFTKHAELLKSESI